MWYRDEELVFREISYLEDSMGSLRKWSESCGRRETKEGGRSNGFSLVEGFVSLLVVGVGMI